MAERRKPGTFHSDLDPLSELSSGDLVVDLSQVNLLLYKLCHLESGVRTDYRRIV